MKDIIGGQTECTFYGAYEGIIPFELFIIKKERLKMRFAKCCKECVLNHNCLLQEYDDVESCSDFQKPENQLNKRDVVQDDN